MFKSRNKDCYKWQHRMDYTLSVPGRRMFDKMITKRRFGKNSYRLYWMIFTNVKSLQPKFKGDK